jgi:RND family efflux transporter MFP subunit
MPSERPRRKHRWLILPPIAIGIAVLVWLAQNREPPARVDADERSHAVRVLEAQAVDLVPTAEGYGPVRPAKVWKAVAQVAGRIIEIHPRLRDGEILAAGTELLRIDPIDYELALAQAEAELAELAVEEENVRASLEIEERNRGLADQELERLQKLSRQRTVSDSDVDQAERAALTTRGAVQTLKNKLTLIPTQRRLLESEAARAERDLERTRILAPFDLRIANLEVEADQYVGVGQTLFEGDAVDRVEMDVQVPLFALRRLFLDRPELVVEPTRISELLPAVIGLDPLVRLDLGDTIAEWDAEFVRLDDQVDPQTRTLGVVVAVDRPFDKIIPGMRPPLSKGMFVEVILRGRRFGARVVVPRSAVRNGAVYLVDEEQRLRLQPVELLFSQDEWAVIAEGIAPGDRVVLSDLIPAVPGMLLDPQPDAELTAELASLGQTGRPSKAGSSDQPEPQR